MVACDYKLRYTLEALEEELRWEEARSSLFKVHRMRKSEELTSLNSTLQTCLGALNAPGVLEDWKVGRDRPSWSFALADTPGNADP